MTREPVIPSALLSYYDEWQMSPGHRSGNHVFLTGFTGVQADGTLSIDPATQIRGAFDKIGTVLQEAGLDFGSLVEMTTYHIGLKDHLELFKRIRAEYVTEPYPAWTAIEVAGFAHASAIIEIRAIACVHSGPAL